MGTSSGDCTVKIWDMVRETCHHTFTDHAQAVWGCSFHSSSDFLATCSTFFPLPNNTSPTQIQPFHFSKQYGDAGSIAQAASSHPTVLSPPPQQHLTATNPTVSLSEEVWGYNFRSSSDLVASCSTFSPSPTAPHRDKSNHFTFPSSIRVHLP